MRAPSLVGRRRSSTPEHHTFLGNVGEPFRVRAYWSSFGREVITHELVLFSVVLKYESATPPVATRSA
jgi:hypothetical protein